MLHGLPALVTAEEMARYLKLRPSTVKQWGRSGKIPVVKLGYRTRRYKVADVLAALELHEATALYQRRN